jgi:creatinine amidohydrolase
MIWEKLTHVEFAALDRNIPAVINIAAVEQHGPHLPVDVDCQIGQHFCDRIDAALQDKVLILPQIKVCCSQHHMDFPGTLTVSHATFLAYLSDILESALAHGFRNIFILNSHGGNQAIGRVAVESLGPRVIAADGQLAFASWWDVASTDLKELNVSGPQGVGHACEFETSLMQLIDPEIVKGSEIGGMSYDSYRPWADGDMLRAPSVNVYRTMKSISGGTGTVGNPSFATAEKGQEISDVVVARLVEILIDFRSGAVT